jgi:hypothetical protein
MTPSTLLHVLLLATALPIVLGHFVLFLWAILSPPPDETEGGSSGRGGRPRRPPRDKPRRWPPRGGPERRPRERRPSRPRITLR